MSARNGKRKCGAATRAGGQCGLPAGHGGPNPGHGPCARHGAHLPGPRKAAAKLALLDEAREWATDSSASPVELMLFVVRKAAAQAILSDQLAIEARAGRDATLALVWTREARDALRLSLEATSRALQLHLDKRVVSQAEAVAAQIVEAMTDFAGRLGHSLDAPEVRAAAGESLRLVAARDPMTATPSGSARPPG